MGRARAWLRRLWWGGAALVLAFALLYWFVLRHRPGAAEAFEGGIVLLVFGIMSLVVLGLMLQFLGSLRRPTEEPDWGEPLLRLQASRLSSAAVVLVLLIFGAVMAFAWHQVGEPAGALDPAPPPRSLTATVAVVFFSVVWAFLLLAFTVRTIRHPAWFVLTRKGFVYRPGDISAGLVRWDDVVEIKEDEVVVRGPAGGPTTRPALVIVLRDGARYADGYNPVLAGIVRGGTRMLRAQTDGRGDIYLDPVHFGARYEEVKALLQEHTRRAA